MDTSKQCWGMLLIGEGELRRWGPNTYPDGLAAQEHVCCRQQRGQLRPQSVGEHPGCPRAALRQLLYKLERHAAAEHVRAVGELCLQRLQQTCSMQ